MEGKATAPDKPYCTNIINAQHYKLKPDEMLFFEWLLVKYEAFGCKEFYYSLARIEKETRIARRRHEAIIKKFSEMQFLACQVKPHALADKGRVMYYNLDLRSLSGCLDDMMEEPLLSKFKGYLKFLVQEQQKGMTKKAIREASQKDSDNKKWLSIVKVSINNVYADRVGMYNKGKLTNGEAPELKKNATSMPINRKAEKELLSIREEGYTLEDIERSFIAFADHLLTDGRAFDTKQIERPMDYFTHRDDYGDHPVFYHFLNKFTIRYGRS